MRKVHPLFRIIFFIVGLAVINYAAMLFGAVIGSLVNSRHVMATIYLVSLPVGIAVFIFYGRRWFRVEKKAPTA